MTTRMIESRSTGSNLSTTFIGPPGDGTRGRSKSIDDHQDDRNRGRMTSTGLDISTDMAWKIIRHGFQDNHRDDREPIHRVKPFDYFRRSTRGNETRGRSKSIDGHRHDRNRGHHGKPLERVPGEDRNRCRINTSWTPPRS